MNKILTFFLAVVSLYCINAQSWQSVKRLKIKSRYGASVSFIESDPNGDLIVGGTFSEYLATDSKTYHSYNGIGAFIIKLDDENNIVWEHVWESSTFQNHVISATLDAQGNIYVGLSGVYEKASYNNFDNTLDDRVIKMNNAGEILFEKSFVNSSMLIRDLVSNGEEIYALVKGNSYQWDGTTYSNAISEYSTSVIRFDNNLTLLDEQVISNDDVNFSDFDISPDHLIAAIGSYNQTVNVFGMELNVVEDNSRYDIAIVELDNKLDSTRVRSYGESGSEIGRGISYNSLGDWIVHGEKDYNLFGTNYGFQRLKFVARITKDESLKFGRNLGDTDAHARIPIKNMIAVSSDDKVYFADTYQGSFSTYNIYETSTGLDDGIVAEMSSTYLTPQWHLELTGEDTYQMISTIGLDKNEFPVVGGVFDHSMHYGVGQIFSNEAEALFIARTFSNDRPYFESYPASGFEMDENVYFERSLAFYDSDADTIYLDTSGTLPEGISFERLDGDSIRIFGTPAIGSEGEYLFTVKINDGYYERKASLDIIVNGPNTDFERPYIIESVPEIYTGKLTSPSPEITITFNEPISDESFMLEFSNVESYTWNESRTVLTINLQNIEDGEYYGGWISYRDEAGNGSGEDIGFEADFTITSLAGNSDCNEKNVQYYNLLGNYCGNNLSDLVSGIYIKVYSVCDKNKRVKIVIE